MNTNAKKKIVKPVVADPPDINREWFLNQLAMLKMNQRGLAKLLNVDPSAITLILQGRRKLTIKECHAISSVFNTPVSEVLRQAGLDVRDDIMKVKVTGVVTEKSYVTLLPDGTHDEVFAPADVPKGTFCVQIRQPGEHNDGWMMFISGERTKAISLIDRPALVALPDGRMLTAVIRRGYKADTVNLFPMPSKNGILENQIVAWASPILWIRPS